ncbi:hypothetical protein [Sedimentibacter saalensis]|uniref:hypothetical protein n=1 Tax=Sedimentibacter saalensis TaxID=130788 RepID=UPI0028A10F72|nr:hypothetical protein [Sedimentibacter saalensis]
MRRKKTPNIDFIVGMAEEFVNGGDYWDFTLDFMHYFIEKYDAMCREDEVYADMINYYLFENAFDNHREDSEDKLRKIMKKALKDLKSGDIL